MSLLWASFIISTGIRPAAALPDRSSSLPIAISAIGSSFGALCFDLALPRSPESCVEIMKEALLCLLMVFCSSVAALPFETVKELKQEGFPLFSPRPLSPVLDVAIIGGGQSGLSLCLALQKRGIFDVEIFDQANAGQEGPWLTTARMETLRSIKELPGPALSLQTLSFESWYKDRFENWNEIEFAPTELWAAYLQWFAKTLHLPINNGWKLLSIKPENGLLRLVFSQKREVLCRKVVLATGRTGCGGLYVPAVIASLPKSCWYHTGELIDPQFFYGKTIVIVGAGASAYDVAGCALEHGAKNVTMVMRRSYAPTCLPLEQCSSWKEYASWSDEKRLCFFEWAWQEGILIPPNSLARVEKWANFTLLPETVVDAIEPDLVIHTNKGDIFPDLIIAATGYQGSVASTPELCPFQDQILSWQDRLPTCPKKAAGFPYLGPHFELLEKHPGTAPWLRHIHCFNYGAYLSHGPVAGEIHFLPIGVERLATGLAQDLFDNFSPSR